MAQLKPASETGGIESRSASSNTGLTVSAIASVAPGQRISPTGGRSNSGHDMIGP